MGQARFTLVVCTVLHVVQENYPIERFLRVVINRSAVSPVLSTSRHVVPLFYISSCVCCGLSLLLMFRYAKVRLRSRLSRPTAYVSQNFVMTHLF